MNSSVYKLLFENGRRTVSASLKQINAALK